MRTVPRSSAPAKPCLVDGCERGGRIRRGYCAKHYRAQQLYGDPLLTWQQVKPPKTCSIDGCERPPWARGWCSLHWQRWKRYGDPNQEPQVRVWGDVCRHVDCDKPRRSGGGQGYCSMHYGRLKRTGDVGGGTRQVMATSWAGATCSIDGCDSPVDSLGYCNLHYLRMRRTGDPLVVKRTPSLAGVACSLNDCGSPAFSKGLCKIHYDRKQRHGDPNAFFGFTWAGTPCGARGCVEEAKTKGYCRTHYQRMRKFGDPNHPARKFQPAKGHTCTVDGCNSERKANGLCAYHAQIEYNIRNPLSKIAGGQRRRARKMSATVVPYSHADLALRMAACGNRCWMCGGPFQEVDHVKPLSRGGKECLSNLRPACRPCNRSKGAKWYGIRDLRRFIKT